MAEYSVMWKVVFDAEDGSEAAARHLEALEAMDEAPCSVYVWGDGPQLSNASMGLSFSGASANLEANTALVIEAMNGPAAVPSPGEDQPEVDR